MGRNCLIKKACLTRKGMSMKKNNDKGFSLVELLGVILILGILITAAVMAYGRYNKKSKQQSYDTMAKSVTSSVEEYMMDNGEVSRLRISELVNGNYLKQTEDPGRRGKTCDGNVKVIHQESDDSSLNENSYVVRLCCHNYKMEYSFPEGTQTKINSCEFDDDELEPPIVKLYSWKDNTTEPTKETAQTLNKYTPGQESKVPVISIPSATSTTKNVDHFEYKLKVDGKITEKDIDTEYLNIKDEGEVKIAWRVCDSSSICSDYSNFQTIIINTKEEEVVVNPPAPPNIENPSKEMWTKNSFKLTLTPSDDTKNVESYQYTYNEFASSTGEDADNEWVAYKNSNKVKFVTTDFSKERNQYVYIRLCIKGNVCSKSSKTMIRIDKTSPTCGDWTGEGSSSNWTNQNRTIGVKCLDSASGCTNDTFTKTFTEEATTANVDIKITDNAGNSKTCNKSNAIINIDRKKPIIGIRDFSTVFQLYDKYTAMGDDYFKGSPYESMYNNYKNDVVMITGRDCSGINTKNGPAKCDTAFQITGRLFYYFALECVDSESGCNINSKKKTCTTDKNTMGNFQGPNSQYFGNLNLDNCTFSFLQGLSKTQECMTMEDNAGNVSDEICINSDLTYLSTVPSSWSYN